MLTLIVGKDQVFKYKFSKEVAARVAKLEIEKVPAMSIRWVIQIMNSFASSNYIGQECWQVISKLIEKHSKDGRFPLRVEEIKLFLSVCVSRSILNHTSMSLIWADIINLMEGSRLTYNDIYDLITTLYSHKVEAPKVIDLMIDYYVQRGYDDDELKLLGNSKAWKLLKAISTLNPDSPSKFNGIFCDAWFDYVNKSYKNFTSLQLKRALEFFENIKYFKNFENQKIDGVPHPTSVNIKEFKDFYHKKLMQQQEKRQGFKIQMKNEETTLNQEEQKEDDPIFEKDLSEDEEMLENQMKLNPKLREEVNYRRYKESNLIHSTLKGIDFSQVQKEQASNTKTHEEYNDPRINRILNLVDESYKKYEKNKPKEKNK